MEERQDKDMGSMTEEINKLLEKLKFSEDESTRVMSTREVNNARGFESWAIGKIMVTELPNREAMYRVFKSLWFTKEEVDFVALREGAVIVKFGCLEDRSRILNLSPWLFDRCLFSMMPFENGKAIDTYEFWMAPFWLRIYNIPIELMDRQTALDIGNAIGELVAIDWKDRNGGWTEFIRIKFGSWLRAPIASPNQERSMRRNGVEFVHVQTQMNEVIEESQINSRDESGQIVQKGKEKGGEEDSTTNSPVEKRTHKTISKSGGLALLWKESNMVEIQTFSSNHIDSKVYTESGEQIRFTGYYGNSDPSKRQTSWNMLRRVGKNVKEKWIIGGDFNAILENVEKEGGRRKPLALMEDFREIIDELSMVDLKTDNGWFTWVNNREGKAMVKERLDRFLMSANDVNSFPLPR
ncbi:hypothetical protein Goshw_021310 [Gossypium schwendimanii]|uniref:DUF4283 domain-containing protein n=1 Tax=Gossypium schwendimanii TaxID=34291 RepID=A0A7J9MDF4_GOSSC|nr:hypothetical protein [Gossypium schwendimanii]